MPRPNSRPFYDKRMSHEVPADSLGDDWKGYIFRISGGNDKQGFPMMQGVLTNKRVKLLLDKSAFARLPGCGGRVRTERSRPR